MANVGDVLDVAYTVAEVAQIADDYVKGDVGLSVADVGVIVDGGSTDVHAHKPLVQGTELLPLAAQAVEDVQCH